MDVINKTMYNNYGTNRYKSNINNEHLKLFNEVMTALIKAVGSTV